MYVSAFCNLFCLNAIFKNLLMSLLLESSTKLLYINSAKLKYVHATSVEHSSPLAFDKANLISKASFNKASVCLLFCTISSSVRCIIPFDSCFVSKLIFRTSIFV